jgi:hypothetical protein
MAAIYASHLKKRHHKGGDMRCLLLVFLMLTTTPTWAEWVKVTASSDDVYYLDPSTIRRDGNFRKAWTLIDFIKMGRKGVHSLKAFKEFDCKEERFRVLTAVGYAGQMGTGTVLGSENPTIPFGYVAPNTASADQLRFVCAR